MAIAQPASMSAYHYAALCQAIKQRADVIEELNNINATLRIEQRWDLAQRAHQIEIPSQELLAQTFKKMQEVTDKVTKIFKKKEHIQKIINQTIHQDAVEFERQLNTHDTTIRTSYGQMLYNTQTILAQKQTPLTLLPFSNLSPSNNNKNIERMAVPTIATMIGVATLTDWGKQLGWDLIQFPAYIAQNERLQKFMASYAPAIGTFSLGIAASSVIYSYCKNPIIKLAQKIFSDDHLSKLPPVASFGAMFCYFIAGPTRSENHAPLHIAASIATGLGTWKVARLATKTIQRLVDQYNVQLLLASEEETPSANKIITTLSNWLLNRSISLYCAAAATRPNAPRPELPAHNAQLLGPPANQQYASGSLLRRRPILSPNPSGQAGHSI
ncbi:MAG TPA: hypothetical protein VLE95_02685 [Chlamydiales bacterium]|nr:hypothetical protein [Chlamydiales bacterium]